MTHTAEELEAVNAKLLEALILARHWMGVKASDRPAMVDKIIMEAIGLGHGNPSMVVPCPLCKEEQRPAKAAAQEG